MGSDLIRHEAGDGVVLNADRHRMTGHTFAQNQPSLASKNFCAKDLRCDWCQGDRQEGRRDVDGEAGDEVGGCRIYKSDCCEGANDFRQTTGTGEILKILFSEIRLRSLFLTT